MNVSEKKSDSKNLNKTHVKTSKKHPNANLDNYSKLFVQLGLVLSLLVVYVLIQNKSFNNEIALLPSGETLLIDDTAQIIELKTEPKQEIVAKKIIVDIITQIDDDTDDVETIVEGNDPSTPIDISSFKTIKKDDFVPPADEFFDIHGLEEAPLFPGCKGTNEERKDCFSKEISKYINRKFNSGLAGELGLSPGVQKIYTMFKIDKNGNIVDVEARAPHKRLQEEAIRVINSLPKMHPGKQHGKPVKVRYAVPIAFKIE